MTSSSHTSYLVILAVSLLLYPSLLSGPKDKEDLAQSCHLAKIDYHIKHS